MRALITVLLPQKSEGTFLDEGELDNIFRSLRILPTKLLSKQTFDQLSFSSSNMSSTSEEISESLATGTANNNLTPVIPSNYTEYDEYRRAYCIKQAKPILDRMPQHTDDEKQKLAQAKQSIICASRLPESYAECAVFIETEGALLFRIHSPKTENLRKGCEEIVRKINSYNKTVNLPLVIAPEIEIYEHGLEYPTISGFIIRSKWKSLLDRASINIAIALFSLSAFFSFYYLSTKITDQFWLSYIINFSSAFLVSFCIALISILNTYVKLIPLIEWDPRGEERPSVHS